MFSKICFAKRIAEEVRRSRHWKFAHFIIPRVSLWHWFEGKKEDRKFVSTVSRIMSGHCRSQSNRFRIVEEAMVCVLEELCNSVSLIWYCEKFETERRRLTNALTALDVQSVTSILGRLGISIWCPFSRIYSQMPRTLDGLSQWSTKEIQHKKKTKCKATSKVVKSEFSVNASSKIKSFNYSNNFFFARASCNLWKQNYFLAKNS
jgi:hypothetical protein